MKLGNWLKQYTKMEDNYISKDDTNFLRSVYLLEKRDIEKLIEKDLDIWSYGNQLL